MNCPNGHVSTSTDYCSVCGVKMVADSEPATSGDPAPSPNRVCPKCQTTQLDPNGQFCENCGHKLDEQVPVSPDLPPNESMGAVWRIECLKEKAGAEEAARAVYETAFELILKNPLTQIGRSSQKRNLHPEIACDWDDAVSHRHAKIELDPEGNPVLIDVGSTNGTMVNGQIISANTPTKLKDGDRISLGGKTALIVHGPQK